MQFNSAHRLITEGLGYCCPWAFFQFFHNNTLIAARLGVIPRTIRRVRGQHTECAKCTGCCAEIVAERARRLAGSPDTSATPTTEVLRES